MKIIISCCWKDTLIRFGSMDLLRCEEDKVRLKIKSISLRTDYEQPRNADLIISSPECVEQFIINSSYGIEVLDALGFIDAHKFSQEEVRNLYLSSHRGKRPLNTLPPPTLD